jgi:guanine deaminase
MLDAKSFAMGRTEKSTPADFMRRAIALSRHNVIANAENPFGAVIVRDGRIIAEGVTQRLSTNDPTAHAEIVAIRLAAKALGKNDLSECEIYASGEPCPMCTAAIWYTGLRTVYYGNARAVFAELGLDTESVAAQVCLPASQRSRPHIQLLAQEARSVIDEWRMLPQFGSAMKP